MCCLQHASKHKECLLQSQRANFFFCQSWGSYTQSLRFRSLSSDRKPLQMVKFFQESFNDVNLKCESTSSLINRHQYITTELWRAIMQTSSIPVHNTWKFSYVPAGMIRTAIFSQWAVQCCCQPQHVTYDFLTSVYCVLTKPLFGFNSGWKIFSADTT
jgi:hypothetical protein